MDLFQERKIDLIPPKQLMSYILTKEKKNHFHKEKALDKNLTPIHDKNSQQIRNRRKLPQSDQKHL